MFCFHTELVLQTNEVVDQFFLVTYEKVIDPIHLIKESMNPLNRQSFRFFHQLVSLIRHHIIQVLLLEIGNQVCHIF